MATIDISIRTMAFLLLVHGLILISTVKVKSQEPDLPCKEPRPLACPELVCKLMNSRKTDFCKDIQCEGLTSENCANSDSEFRRGMTMCGCCPGCVKLLDENDPCEVSPPDPERNVDCTDPFCPILTYDCKDGLVCDYLGEGTKTCVVDKSAPVEEEDDEDFVNTACEDRRYLGLIKKLHWTPNCEEDGSYSPKQCKGTRDDGICFCSDGEGRRIFGREWWSKSDNQTCACSRQVDILRSEGNIAAIHCSYDGNYEALQCDMDSGVCYCVEPQTGKLTGAVLPEHQWKELPCYSLNVTGGDPTGGYLRICESEWVAAQRIRKEAELHGLFVLSGRDLKCDFDGTYSPMLRQMGIMYCADKMGKTGANFQEIDLRPMNCQCYRDSLLYKEEGRPFVKSCHNSTGNYAPTSVFENHEGNETYRCVDRDGVFLGHIVGTNDHCCLLGTCPDNTECYNPNNPDGYRTCASWPK